MSLIGFHRFLIAAAIVFCAGYALWELLRVADGGGLRSVALVVAFSAAALGFGYYLRHLGRILRLPEPDDQRESPPGV
jgi:hypothetical protein